MAYRSNFAMTDGRKSSVWKPGERNKGDREETERFQSEDLELPFAFSPTGLKGIVTVEKAWKLPIRLECSPRSTTVTQNNQKLKKTQFYYNDKVSNHVLCDRAVDINV